jgi:aminotransferase
MTSSPPATSPPATSRARLSQRVRDVPPSGIRRFFDVINSMPDVISLGVGEPDFDTPAVIVEEGIRSLREGRTHYTSNYGTLELRHALARHLERRYRVSYDPEREIVMTVGVSEGLAASLAAIADPGDEIIMAEPTYVAYVPDVVFAGARPVFVPARPDDGWQLDPDAVEAAITPRTKALFLGFPNNPTGAVLEPERRRALAAIADRHDLLVISDEVYDRLVYGGHQHEAFSALSGMRERTILLGGFSKAYAMTGWRIGYAAGPAEVIGAMTKIHQYTMLCASITAQMAAIEALHNGERDMEEMVGQYDARRRLVVSRLNQIGLDCHEPEGAFYVFPSIRRTGLSSEEFAEALLREERVAVVPGDAFGDCGTDHIRCSYAASVGELEEALRRMERFTTRRLSESQRGEPVLKEA